MTPNKKSSAAAVSHREYHRYLEFERVTSKAILTDAGLYLDKQVPDNYGGAQLEIDLVHAVSLIDGKGELLILEFAPPLPKDKTDKTDWSVKRDGVEIRAGSAVVQVQTTVKNVKLDPKRSAYAGGVKEKFIADLAKFNQPKSAG